MVRRYITFQCKGTVELRKKISLAPFGTESNESTEETPEAQSVGDNRIEEGESDGNTKERSYTRRISLNNSNLYYFESRK